MHLFSRTLMCVCVCVRACVCVCVHVNLHMCERETPVLLKDFFSHIVIRTYQFQLLNYNMFEFESRL